MTIGMLSLPCGWLCTTIGLPTMFGYIICGVLLGPSGLNSIKVRIILFQCLTRCKRSMNEDETRFELESVKIPVKDALDAFFSPRGILHFLMHGGLMTDCLSL